ncbi:MAG TPA: hypothetical protein VHZ76_02755 [Gammaproteobacteria bacterium]|jgi:hypothetical protein|nr:hypothetical protein [Gammaproteobacteria bacterium]
MNNRDLSSIVTAPDSYADVVYLIEKQQARIDVLHPSYKIPLISVAAKEAPFETFVYLYKKLMEQNPYGLDASEYEENLLEQASQNPDPRILAFITQQPDLAEKLNDGTTPLQIAAMTGVSFNNEEMNSLEIEELLTLNQRDQDVFYWAALTGEANLQVVEQHLQHFSQKALMLFGSNVVDNKCRGRAQRAFYARHQAENESEQLETYTKAIEYAEEILVKTNIDYKFLVRLCWRKGLILGHLYTQEETSEQSSDQQAEQFLAPSSELSSDILSEEFVKQVQEKLLTEAITVIEKANMYIEKVKPKTIQDREFLAEYFYKIGKFYYNNTTEQQAEPFLYKALFCCKMLEQKNIENIQIPEIVDEIESILYATTSSESECDEESDISEEMDSTYGESSSDEVSPSECDEESETSKEMDSAKENKSDEEEETLNGNDIKRPKKISFRSRLFPSREHVFAVTIENGIQVVRPTKRAAEQTENLLCEPEAKRLSTEQSRTLLSSSK